MAPSPKAQSAALVDRAPKYWGCCEGGVHGYPTAYPAMTPLRVFGVLSLEAVRSDEKQTAV
eukprot:4593578-Prymnesium_polylepis.1